MINRRHLLGATGAGIALAGSGLVSPRLFGSQAQAQPLQL